MAPSAPLPIPLRARAQRAAEEILAAASLMLLLAVNGCSDAAAPPPEAGRIASAAPVVTAAESASPAPGPTPDEAAGLGRFADLVTTLSEPNGEFFSDNLISNETSYLQVASELAARPAGGVYIGVGPEQNFTYVALARPRVAFIVDIRRANMLQHLHYRVLFDEAQSRSHFLALLLGRPYDAAGEPGAGAGLDAVIAHAERRPPDENALLATFERTCQRIERDYGVPLNAEDRKTLEVIARRFLKDQLEIRFELHEPSGRRYPTLRELLAQADPTGARRGFLVTEEAFRFVQRMQREGRIIPLVGDFAGDRAMPGIARLLRDKGLTVSAFYVSNVEQYLLEPKVWQKWTRNVAALPADGAGVFVRAYLDQGRRHPRQMQGHRTATVLQGIVDFNAREEKTPSRSFWTVATTGIL
jgi:hypothetical protein